MVYTSDYQTIPNLAFYEMFPQNLKTNILIAHFIAINSLKCHFNMPRNAESLYPHINPFNAQTLCSRAGTIESFSLFPVTCQITYSLTLTILVIMHHHLVFYLKLN
jgi:hypothetical protein